MIYLANGFSIREIGGEDFFLRLVIILSFCFKMAGFYPEAGNQVKLATCREL